MRSAGLIVLGMSIGVVAMFVLHQDAGPQVESDRPGLSPSGDVPESIAARDTQSVSDEQELLEIIAELEELVTDLNARLQESRRLVTYYEDRDLRRLEALREPSRDQVVERLVATGLTEERAEWVFDRSYELYRESVAAMYSIEHYANSREGRLRQEIGDAEFEAYLTAIGEVPAVRVGAVSETSTAGLAGLRRGDHIRSYDGHRVFDIRELIPLTLQHGTNERVVVDIARDDQPMRLIVPGGAMDVELSSGEHFTAPSFDPGVLLSK